MPIVYIDCSNTYGSEATTGIQRVVRNLVRHCVAADADPALRCIPVAFDGVEYIPVDADIVRAAGAQTGIGRRFARAGRRLYRIVRERAYAMLPFDAVHRFLFAPAHAPGLTWALVAPMRALRRLRRRRGGTASVRFDADSVLLLADAPTHLDTWPAIRAAKRSGALVVCVIYDVLPLEMAEYFPPSLVEAFTRWIRSALAESDALMTISEDVRRRLLARTKDRSPRPPVAFFPLGHELDRQRGSPTVREDLRRILAESARAPLFLMVGTIEPRKNHVTVLRALDRLWSQGFPGRLLVVGAVGWKCDDLLDEMGSHAERAIRMHVFHDLTDAELEACYQGADALVAASWAEGFGLPILEAAARGVPVIASDIAVFHEAAPANARFFAPGDAAMLASHLAETSKRSCAGASDPQVYRGWSCSAQALMSELVSLHRQARCISSTTTRSAC